MNDRELVQRQYERVQEKVASWPESLREIPSYHELKVGLRQHDMKTGSIKRERKD